MQYIFKVMCIAIEICTVKTFLLLLPIHHLPGVEGPEFMHMCYIQ